MTPPPRAPRASSTRDAAPAVFCTHPLARLPRAGEDAAVFFRCLYACILLPAVLLFIRFFALVTCRGRTPTRVDDDVLRLAPPCVRHEDVCQCTRVPSVSRARPLERSPAPGTAIARGGRTKTRGGVGRGERRAEVRGGTAERRRGWAMRQDISRIAKGIEKISGCQLGRRAARLTESESASRSSRPTLC